jgi:hypothetical protein
MNAPFFVSARRRLEDSFLDSLTLEGLWLVVSRGMSKASQRASLSVCGQAQVLATDALPMSLKASNSCAVLAFAPPLASRRFP